jgi:hypothetical protein
MVNLKAIANSVSPQNCGVNVSCIRTTYFSGCPLHEMFFFLFVIVLIASFCYISIDTRASGGTGRHAGLKIPS